MSAAVAVDRRNLHVGVAGLRVRLHRRTLLVSLALAGVVAGAVAVSVSVGAFPIPLREVVPAIVGVGDSDSDFIIRRLRLPRAFTGALVGASFGLSGAIFQSLARNALASPDLIGITAGASAAAVAVIVVIGGGALAVSAGALGGALLTAVAMYLLAYQRGVSGYRLVLIGIGFDAALSGVTWFLLTRAQEYEIQRVNVWLTGSLNGRSWDHVRPVAVALALALPITFALGRQLRLLELGDDTAKALGVRVEPARAGLVAVAVILVAVGTASAGPIAFVALVAPQIARRLVRSAGATLAPSALVGGALVLLADVAARQAFAPTELPVGIVTGLIGAPYLLWLLARANRIGAGG